MDETTEAIIAVTGIAAVAGIFGYLAYQNLNKQSPSSSSTTTTPPPSTTIQYGGINTVINWGYGNYQVTFNNGSCYYMNATQVANYLANNGLSNSNSTITYVDANGTHTITLSTLYQWVVAWESNPIYNPNGFGEGSNPQPC